MPVSWLAARRVQQQEELLPSTYLPHLRRLQKNEKKKYLIFLSHVQLKYQNLYEVVGACSRGARIWARIRI